MLRNCIVELLNVTTLKKFWTSTVVCAVVIFIVISLLTNAISSSRGLTDVMLLSSYIHVRYVDISKNLIRDLTPLNGMTHLLTLNAEFNLLPVVSLEELPYLQKATFAQNQLENLNGFGHPLLESLNLSCKLFHVTYSLLKFRFY